MPRKSHKARGAAAHAAVGLTAGPRPPLKATAPNPSAAAELPQVVVAEAEGLKVPDAGASAAADALERLHVAPASDGDPPPPEPVHEPAAPPQPPPAEASSSGRSAAGGSWEEEAVRKLRELAEVSRDETELTEEEVRANDQRQEDEICALEAIFGDAVVILDRKGGQRSFQVLVHIEVPDYIDVSTKLSYGDGTINYAATHDDDDLFYKFRVEHLPPILLTCLLPTSYPSHRPPFFTISTYWLDKGMISPLCRMLDMLWEEQQGMEVTYQWVQWLQSCSLSHLGFANEVVLRKSDVTCYADGEDKRACPDYASPDVIIPRMMRYNDNKHHEAFLHAIHDCMICLSECPGVDFIKLPCHHFFCWKCMQTYCKMNVKEGNVVKLLCPDTKCEGAVPPNVLKRLLGEDEYERWEGLLLQRTLDAMKDVVYCPRCQTACLEDVGNEAVCSSCLFSFCTLCRNRRHIGEQCMSPEERLMILEKRQESGNVQGDQMKVLQELRSLKEIMKDSKQCPKCRMAISKTEGCNKMHCENCGEYFCYQCNRAITGYEHFRGSCVLFPQEELDRWEMQMNQRVGRQIVAHAHAAIHGQNGQAHPCPTCRQPSPKIGNNNHLFCWACQKHFCALCHKAVQKPAQHYGPKGCKQHTADP